MPNIILVISFAERIWKGTRRIPIFHCVLLQDNSESNLKQNLSCLSISGHGVIYGALALQALKVSPQSLQTPIVDGIIKLLNRTLIDRPNRYYGIVDYKTVNLLPGEDIPKYACVKDMIRATFMETKVVYADGDVGDQHYFFAAEKIHGVTHAHALSTLHDLGYSDLARLGFESHRKQLKLNRMLPPNSNWIKKLAVNNLSPFQPVYWQRDHCDDHALKLACATLELLDKFEKGSTTDFYDSETYWEPFMR